MTRNRLVVVAGGPGAGKTTLMEHLAGGAVTMHGDAARQITRSRCAAGLSLRPDTLTFAQSLLAMEIAERDEAIAREGEHLFERSVIDAPGMLKGCRGTPVDEIERIVQENPNDLVFLATAWQDIYVDDVERDEGFSHARRVGEQTRQWYKRCGYNPIVLPLADVETRSGFVRSFLDAR